MRLISTLLICLGLSACATDYVSQLYQPDYGRRGLHLSEENLDPSMLMNGTYAAKQMKGFGTLCLTGYRCSQPAQQWSGWDP
jgi:hypothetical protein